MQVVTTTRLKRLGGTKAWVDAHQFSELDVVEGVEVLRLDGPLNFVNAGQASPGQGGGAARGSAGRLWVEGFGATLLF